MRVGTTESLISKMRFASYLSVVFFAVSATTHLPSLHCQLHDRLILRYVDVVAILVVWRARDYVSDFTVANAYRS